MKKTSILGSSLVLAVTCSVHAAVLFNDEASSLSNFTVVQDTDTTAAIYDYSALGIPEAPHSVGGSAATTGIKVTANKGDATGAITGLNVILGATPIAFTGTHTLQFDVYMNVPSTVASTSEATDFGVDRTTSDSAIYANYRSSRGNGTWGLLGNDNGLTYDFALQDNANSAGRLALGDATLATEFNTAFQKSITANANAEAGNEWVTVDVISDVSTNTVSVYFNGVFIRSLASTNAPLGGFAWFGYDDSAASIGSTDGVADTNLAGIFDNIVVFEGAQINAAVPEPTAMAVLLPAAALLGRRRRV